MKILYITAEGFDTPNPNNQMAEVMINDFLSAGHKVHLIQSHRKGICDDLPKTLKSRRHLTVDTIRRSVVDKSNFIKRYLNDIRYHLESFRYYRKIKDADLIYLQSNPTIYLPMILIRIFMSRIPIVYSIYDVFPGHAYDIGVIKSRFLYNALRWLQKPCYKIPKIITVLSEDMKDIVVREGARPDDVHVVPAWFDVSTAKEIPVSENQFINKYQIDTSKFYVQFAGTIGYVFNYKTVIEVAKRLITEKDIVFQMIGDGATKADFVKEASDNRLNNIQFYPLQPVSIVPDVYSACNLSLIPLKKGVIGNGVPSKLPILMACKRLTITAVESWSKYAKMIKDNEMGLVEDVSDYDALASAIIFAKNNTDKVSEMVENAYNFGRDNYSSVQSLQILADIFTKYINN